MLRRFESVINDHGLTAPQLVRLVPANWKWTTLTVTDPQQFLGSLGPDQFEWFARKFMIKRDWLEGAGDYPTAWLRGNRYPNLLLKDLKELGWLNRNLRMTVLGDKGKHREGEPPSRCGIVFSYPISQWEDSQRSFYCHAQLGNLWNLHHSPDYMNLMAVARWYVRVLNDYGRIPIVPVESTDLERVCLGACPGIRTDLVFVGEMD